MATIHMEVEKVYEQGRLMMYSASDILNIVDRLSFAVNALRDSWNGPGVAMHIQEMDRTIRSLLAHATELDDLGKRVMREVDEWVDADRTEAAYLSALNDTFSISRKDTKKLWAAGVLATTLRWTAKRPNSIVFTGPNWMREAIGVKEMTRVIRPSNLARGMAMAGVIEAGVVGIDAAEDAFAEFWHEDLTRAISAATVDGVFHTALTAVGSAGIPLLLGAVVGAVGMPVVAAGAVVCGGSVLLSLAYSKFLEAPVWELWRQSTLRTEVIEASKRSIDRVVNAVGDLTTNAIQGVSGAFLNFIEGIVSAPFSALTPTLP